MLEKKPNTTLFIVWKNVLLRQSMMTNYGIEKVIFKSFMAFYDVVINA